MRAPPGERRENPFQAAKNCRVSTSRIPSGTCPDGLRAEAWQAPRGFEVSASPSGLFTGAIGAGLGQAAGGAGGIGGGGGITGNARAVFISPRGTFDPSFTLNFSQDRATSPLNTVRVSGIPVVTGPTTFLQGSYQQAFTTGTSFS